MLSTVGFAAVVSDGLDLATLFDGLDESPALLLAISGGPDSTALLHLAARWRAGMARGPELHVATVDHGLRPGAAAEAAMVATAAARYGLAHATLAWVGAKPAGGIQEKAREARYRLLSEHAQGVGASLILTAHHADDQAETVLMRLGRGSGVAGLAAMRRTTPLTDGIALVRPLLGLTKRALLAICAAEHLPFVVDPSNEDTTFHRVRLRRQAEAAAALGLDPPALLRLARRMARIEEALETEVARAMASLRPVAEPGSWRADIADVRSMAPEIVQRLIGHAVLHVTGAPIVPLEKLETLADSLRRALERAQPCRATLGGALLALDGRGRLVVTPERPRRRSTSSPD